MVAVVGEQPLEPLHEQAVRPALLGILPRGVDHHLGLGLGVEQLVEVAEHLFHVAAEHLGPRTLALPPPLDLGHQPQAAVGPFGEFQARDARARRRGAGPDAVLHAPGHVPQVGPGLAAVVIEERGESVTLAQPLPRLLDRLGPVAVALVQAQTAAAHDRPAEFLEQDRQVHPACSR